MCYTSDGIGDVDMFGDYSYAAMNPYGRRCVDSMSNACTCVLNLPFTSRYRSDCRSIAFTEVIFILHPPPEPSTWSPTSPPMIGNTAHFKYSGSSVLRLSESSFKGSPLGRAGWPQDASQPSDSHVWRLDGSDEPYQLLVCANQQSNSGFSFWSTHGNACAPQVSLTCDCGVFLVYVLTHDVRCSVIRLVGAPPTHHPVSCFPRLLCSAIPTPTCKLALYRPF
jgi:hypothetical protein